MEGCGVWRVPAACGGVKKALWKCVEGAFCRVYRRKTRVKSVESGLKMGKGNSPGLRPIGVLDPC